jgi:hypothetical protein
MERLSQQVLETRVSGRKVPEGPLADRLGPDPTLLVFLRHFG